MIRFHPNDFEMVSVRSWNHLIREMSKNQINKIDSIWFETLKFHCEVNNSFRLMSVLHQKRLISSSIISHARTPILRWKIHQSSIMFESHEISINHYRAVIIATKAQYWNEIFINHQSCSSLMKFLLIIIVL